MLRVQCGKCEGELYLEVDNKKVKCDCEYGYVNADENMKVYVNVYKITRHYGGAEEGGWYYNWFECLESVPCKNKYSEEIALDLEIEYDNMKHGNIYSVLGGADIQIMVESKMKKSESKERPHYE